MTAGRFYVTTPIYYVNDRPHIGHAYTTLLADVLARYHRMMGMPTHFLTGTDEHGQKVRQAASRAGIDPQEQADRTVVRFRTLWEKLEITHDDFIRTTEARHVRVVRSILQDLFDRDQIYKSEYDGWYCVTCERFFTEKDLVEGRCPETGCGRRVDPIREANYFFRMSRYQEWLVRHIREHPGFIRPEFRRNETLGFLRKPLTDLCISRPKSRLDWGVELPFDRDYVTYVWFDALVNYISAVGYGEDAERFGRWWPASVHLIGKDILTTHTVYWPTMLKAIGLPLPETVFAHGWWLAGQDKMSKSEGNVIDPMAFVDRFGVDAFRYFLMAEMTVGQDAGFTEAAFVRRFNADLANDLGNLLNRVMKLIESRCGARIPAPEEPGQPERELSAAVCAAVQSLPERIERMAIDGALAEMIGAVRCVNRYMEGSRPWVLAREGRRGALNTVLYTAAESLRVIAGALHPVMPDKMSALRAALGLSREAPEFSSLQRWGGLVPGQSIGRMPNLFPRIRVSPENRGPQTEKTPDTGVATVETTDFAKVHLRTARVMEAERIAGTDKLMCLQIRVGSQTRQIVAGIAGHYAPREVVGKTVVIVANLKPSNIRGVASDGMLLAASSGDVLRLVTVDGDVPDGAVVR